jgi:hypothetical protein
MCICVAPALMWGVDQFWPQFLESFCCNSKVMYTVEAYVLDKNVNLDKFKFPEAGFGI